MRTTFEPVTPDNFDKIVDGTKYAFVEFYAPWCGHCKHFASDYADVAKAVSASKDAHLADVVLGKVNADKHKELGGRFGVHGFPTIKWFHKTKDKPDDYEGSREVQDVLKFIDGKVGSRLVAGGPRATKVMEPDNIDQYIDQKSKCRFVKFFAPWCGHCKKLAPTWDKLASVFQSEDDVIIGEGDAATHAELGKRFKVEGYPTLLFWGKGDVNFARYEGGRELKDMVTYVNEKCGTRRKEDGMYADTVGRVASLDTVVRDWDGKNLAAVKEAVAKVDLDDRKYATYYASVARSVAEKGQSYIETETGRLQRIIEKGELMPKKIDEFVWKQHVLAAFKKA